MKTIKKYKHYSCYLEYQFKMQACMLLEKNILEEEPATHLYFKSTISWY